MTTMAERLIEARRGAGYESATDAARALGVKEPTYLAHENGSRGFLRSAERYARFFRVNLEWLLNGRGLKRSNSPDDPADEAIRDTLRKTTTDRASRLIADRAFLATDEVRRADVKIPSRLKMPKNVPVLGTAGAAQAGAFNFTGDVIDYVRRPPALENVPDAYAIYVQGTSMVPKIEPGDLRFVHPGRPIQIGDLVILQIQTHKGADIQVFIKILAARKNGRIFVHQLNPPGTTDWDGRFVIAMHKVLSMNDLFGV